MTDVPERCPTCAMAVPLGAGRCPGCGRVFGEENRCPHCHAVAAVRPVGSVTVCAACGKPRAGAVGLDGAKVRGIRPSTRPGVEAGSREMSLRLGGRSRRLAGILAIAVALVLAVLIPVVTGGGLGYLLAAVVALVALALGGLALRSGSAQLVAADQQGQQARALAIRELAAAHAGRLTAAQVATSYGLSVREADDALTAMVGDRSEVDVEVDDDGGVAYVFAELVPESAKVRVAEEDAEEDELEADPFAPHGESRSRREPPGGR